MRGNGRKLHGRVIAMEYVIPSTFTDDDIFPLNPITKSIVESSFKVKVSFVCVMVNLELIVSNTIENPDVPNNFLH
jgi:hypothetical protein